MHSSIKRSSLLVLVGIATGLWVTESSAREPEEPASDDSFGGSGQLVLDSLLGMSLTTATISSPHSAVFVPSGWLSFWHADGEDSFADNKYSTKTRSFAARPSVDYFVTEGLSVGGSVQGTYGTVEMNHSSEDSSFHQEGDSYGVKVAPRVGLVSTLSEDFAVWTRLDAGYGVGKAHYEGQPTETTTELSAVLEFLLVARPSRSVFFAVGPALTAGKFSTKTEESGSTLRSATLVGGTMQGTLGLIL